MDVKKDYKGRLRPEITLIDGGAMITWVNPENREIIWTETCKPKDNMGFASQIECDGNFAIRSGYFVDKDRNRHFVIHAEPGKLGASMFK